MDHFYLVVTSAGAGACLALLADVDADMGMVAYEMNLLVKRVGTYLSSEPRVADVAAEAGRGS
jgi:predicted regulator of Ras-like GTPase activity (Roadblock/LC7/MglB family)